MALYTAQLPMRLPPLEPVGSVRFLSSIPAIIEEAPLDIAPFFGISGKDLTLAVFFGRNLAVSGVMKYDTTLGPYRGNPSNLQYIGSCLEMIPCHFPNNFFGQWGQTIYIEGKIEKSTPLKTKMTRENQVFEDVSAVRTVDFPLPCWISVGRKPFLNRFFLWQKFTVHKNLQKISKKIMFGLVSSPRTFV